MANLDHTQRGHLIENATYLMERHHVPMSLLASKMMVDLRALEKWLDQNDPGHLIISHEQLVNMAEALGVKSPSNLYSYTLSEIQKRYDSDVPPQRKKPGPKPGTHHKRPGVIASKPDSTVAAKLPAPSQKPLSSMPDCELRAHFRDLLDNPLVPFRDAICIAAKALAGVTTN